MFFSYDSNFWVNKVQGYRKKYPTVTDKVRKQNKYVDSYFFFDTLSDYMTKDDVLVTDQGAAFYSLTTAFKVKKGQLAFTNGGFSPMGYGLPASIGCCFAPGVRKVVSVNGDGGLQMNLQELGTVMEQKHCVYIPFYQDELVVIAPGEGAGEPESAGETAGWIRRMPVILREEGSGTRKEAQRLLRQLGIELSELNIAASIENQETIKRSVRNGMGISILSRLAAEDEIKSGVLRAGPLGETGGKRNINLVFDRRFVHSAEAEALIDLVKKMYPEKIEI